MEISAVLNDEGQNNGCHIRLYSEGIFLKAYERSAWVACRVLHPFMVKKRAVRKVGQEVTSIGFPKTSLAKWAAGRRVESVDDSGQEYIGKKRAERPHTASIQSSALVGISVCQGGR